MQALLTHIRRAVAVLVACVLVCGLVPATALARTASGLVGLEMVVPAQAYIEPTDDTKAANGLVGLRMEVPAQAYVGEGDDTRAASGLVGIRLEVPASAFVEEDPAGTRSASGMVGIRLEVPTQAYTEPTDDTRAASGVMGLRLEVPKQAFSDEADQTKAVSGLVGIRMQVPSAALVEDEGVRAANGLLGMRLQVASVHTVTFDANGGTGTIGVDVLEGARVSEPDPVVAERPGYKIAGWYTDASCADEYAYDWTLPVLGSFTLYAKWWDGPDYEFVQQRYTLNMGCADAVLADTDKDAGVTGDPGVGWADEATYLGAYRVEMGADLPVPAREGYLFKGWHDNAELTGDPIAYISKNETDPRAFWAAWEQLPPEPDEDALTVTFDTRGGSAVDAQYVQPGACAMQPSDPVRAGYDFAGWYADANCLTPFDFAMPIERDTTVHAKWTAGSTEGTERHYVSFVANGGSPVATQKVEHGGYASEPEPPTRPGWKFLGWYVDAAFAGDAFDFARTPIERDTTLYAKWEELVFTVTFVAAPGAFEGAGDGGADVGEIAIEVRGVRIPAEDVPADPKQAGWQFAGWYPEDADAPGQGDFSGDRYDFEAEELTGDLTLYADWSLRLDVTVPVSVGLAVDAGTGKVTAPGMGAYALKSRTVRPVEVESLALRSEQSELEGFFELPEGALPDGASEADRLAAWRGALASTRLTLLAGAPGAAPIGLPLAGDADGSAWRSAYALADAERAAYRIAAFGYAGTAFDELWQGADPSERLPLELGMSIPTDRLKVRADLDGERPVTRLQVTVAARE